MRKNNTSKMGTRSNVFVIWDGSIERAGGESKQEDILLGRNVFNTTNDYCIGLLDGKEV